MPIPSVSILRVETGRKQKNGYPRYPNSFPCVFDPFASLGTTNLGSSIKVAAIMGTGGVGQTTLA